MNAVRRVFTNMTSGPSLVEVKCFQFYFSLLIHKVARITIPQQEIDIPNLAQFVQSEIICEYQRCLANRFIRHSNGNLEQNDKNNIT
ncbi:hypothetical protein T4B_14175 [Trichinella pseudospiralis]|uniref:Uncharacterized protein n=1 Tax=Trichinella pseudospiralis TaxID=6337 RepID=A0A0V1JDR8_TRIPS|nr:hypothetical protein T4B_14175 [Trichinella pseudospiralis]KRZ39546.1 hypothetical protein T4C_12213 [Trichinella pseudospiralis]